MQSTYLLPQPESFSSCIILIGMAASGKSTIGNLLAKELDWAYLDSDHLIEAIYGHRLQDVTDKTDKTSFLNIECQVICSIRANRTVISTGGSVIYRKKAMTHLKKLGTIVYLDVDLATIEKRIKNKPDRGLAIGPNQTIEDLFNERKALYETWANIRCECKNKKAKECVNWILQNIDIKKGP